MTNKQTNPVLQIYPSTETQDSHYADLSDITMEERFLKGLKTIQDRKKREEIKKEKKNKPAPYIKGGQVLAAIRAKLSLSQREMSNLLQIADATLSSWENGINRPRFHSLLGIKSVLPAEYGELIKLEDFGYRIKNPNYY